MRLANWTMCAPTPSPTFQNAPPPQAWQAKRFVKERASIGKRITTTATATRVGKTIGFMSKKKTLLRVHHVHILLVQLARLRQETGPNATFCGGRDRDTTINFPFSF